MPILAVFLGGNCTINNNCSAFSPAERHCRVVVKKTHGQRSTCPEGAREFVAVKVVGDVLLKAAIVVVAVVSQSEGLGLCVVAVIARLDGIPAEIRFDGVERQRGRIGENVTRIWQPWKITVT